ncbi:Trm112 family protein [Oceaniserpentilla sp. 4NH20-0058]|uniref:Trm112 family protein n=1 Tax=Oceaniserpentilla sp. 4NH20-0058 TaxID=3127660 RepID=UPI00310A69D9
MDKKLLSLLVCPLCKGNLILDKEKSELICKFDGVAYKIDDDIPVMLPESGRALSTDEKLAK